MAGFSTSPLRIMIHVLHLIQVASAIIVLGITGWAVRGTKTLTVIYSLIIAALTPVMYLLATGTSYPGRRQKWFAVPWVICDGIISYLWLVSFVLLALNFNHQSCRISRWNGEIVCSRKYAAEAFSFIAL
ncbi:hypothetical protein ASPSYDRAFT_1164381 [Aspergillus sydowii CBS 593.65]|uniref:MARVEL domain-containing protein n=1 Tax=Aspergillus sydowii CBS 593.65 TaxID=1036612 RepID=A0A1L9T2P2_9EURO|nr:uncharacterized protein ASPSYDRAFT_1164381 [Aspergillus sydowii CBS 593.65]OJJ53611.1 hypothetical protein ASPSYDRAFT_1164381 [Aspergillus sydowii CBS 593.65]